MNITTKIRGLGDRDSVITQARQVEIYDQSVIIYQVLTTSPLSEGPVNDIYEWRFLMDNNERDQECSDDYDSQEDAGKAAMKFIKDKFMKNEAAETQAQELGIEFQKTKGASWTRSSNTMSSNTGGDPKAKLRKWKANAKRIANQEQWFDYRITLNNKPLGGNKLEQKLREVIRNIIEEELLREAKLGGNAISVIDKELKEAQSRHKDITDMIAAAHKLGPLVEVSFANRNNQVLEVVYDYTNHAYRRLRDTKKIGKFAAKLDDWALDSYIAMLVTL